MTGGAVHVHVAGDGCIYSASVGGRIARSPYTLAEFSNAAHTNGTTVYTLGLASNAALIATCAAILPAGALWVGSPFVVPARATPAVVLDAALRPSPRQRWHCATLADTCVFQLIGHYAGTSPLSLTAWQSWVGAHPAMPALTFLPGLDRDAAARLVCAIGDPRWYVSARARGRWSGLYAHLGLTLKAVKAYLAGATLKRQECALAVSMWHKHGTRYGSPTNPGNFLWRCLAAQLDAGRDPAVALLRTTTRLVRYLAIYWLAQVAQNSAEMRFYPEEFFATQQEIMSFLLHVQAAPSLT